VSNVCAIAQWECLGTPASTIYGDPLVGSRHCIFNVLQGAHRGNLGLVLLDFQIDYLTFAFARGRKEENKNRTDSDSEGDADGIKISQYVHDLGIKSFLRRYLMLRGKYVWTDAC